MDLLQGDYTPELTVNKQFAEKYRAKKQHEELSKLKDKYGSDYEPSDESSSSDETEDDEGEQLTVDVDAAILRTLARIRKGDPTIYDAKVKIFEDERAKASSSATKLLPSQGKEKKEKPLHLRDYHRRNMEELLKLEGRGLGEDDGASAQEPRTHVQEQAALREEVTRAFHGGADDSDDDLLTLRDKPEEEVKAEEEDYKRFLLETLGDEDEAAVREALKMAPNPLLAPEEGNGGEDVSEENEEGKKEKKKKKSDKGKGKGKEKQKAQAERDNEFLLNYVLNRGWVDHSAKHVPSYAEITGDRRARIKERSASPDKEDAQEGEGEESEVEKLDEIDEEDEYDEKVDDFEARYNFRFQEPDAATVSTYARDLPNTVRRKDDSRKRTREARKERKEAEKMQKMEELKRLKNLKKKEILDKLKQLQELTGNNDVDFENVDLETDFDPEAHDKQMQEMFDDGYYAREEDDDEKPTWVDDVDISNLVGPTKPANSVAQSDGDEHINMDADFLPGGDAYAGASGVKLSKEERKKEKKRLKKAAKKAQEKAAEGAVDGEDVNADGVDEEEMDAEKAGRMEGDMPTTAEERKEKVNEYLDEYYKLDYEDMIGDMPTRFKYTKTAQEDYGLSAVEILLADDAELNQLVGLRKLAPYRKDKGQSAKAAGFGKRLRDLRETIKDRQWGKEGEQGAAKGKKRAWDKVEEVGDGGEGAAKKKRKGKKERERAKAKVAEMTAAGEGGDGSRDGVAEGVSNGVQDASEGDKDAKRKKKKKQRSEEAS